MRPTPINSVLLLVLGGALFTSGYYVGTSPALRTEVAPAAAPPIASDVRTIASAGGVSSFESAVAQFAPGEARVRAFEILNIPDEIERSRQFCTLLGGVNLGNWDEVVEAFMSQERQQGRGYGREWEFLLLHVGKTTGRAALEQAFESKFLRDRRAYESVLRAWAAVDPEAAVAWVRGRPDEEQRALRNDLLSGVGRSDPGKAFSLMVGEPAEVWEDLSFSLVHSAIQLGGLPNAEQVYSILHAHPKVTSEAADHVFSAIAIRRGMIAQAEQNVTALLDWFEPHFPAGPQGTHYLVNYGVTIDPLRTLEWFDARGERMTETQTESVYMNLGIAWAIKAPAEFNAWMNINGEHPQHETMARFAARSMTQTGEFDKARRFAETVRDSKKRGAIEEQIARAEAERAPGRRSE
jgi:hypothetical protein